MKNEKRMKSILEAMELKEPVDQLLDEKHINLVTCQCGEDVAVEQGKKTKCKTCGKMVDDEGEEADESVNEDDKPLGPPPDETAEHPWRSVKKLHHRMNVDIEKDKLQKPANDLSRSVVALKLKVEELFRLSQEAEISDVRMDEVMNLVKEAKKAVMAAIIDLDTK